MYERLFRVAQGQIFIALPPAFQLKGQQEWPSDFGWFFTIDYQR